MAALAFSPIHNITTKSLHLAQPGEVQGGLLSRLLSKVKSLLGKQKKTAAAEEDILGEAGGKPDETGTWKGFVVNPASYLEWSLTVSDYA